MQSGRIIFHVDMNSFYASVEIAHDPSLKGRPLAIAGNAKERRGIVVTSSYEARARGVKTTMPVWEAKRHCPELLILPPDFKKYRSASQKLFTILKDYTPIIERVSIDEGYLDMTTHPDDAVKTAKDIQQRLFDELQLPSSIGIAPNKFLAKMASDMKKPLGLTILRKRDIEQKLWPLAVRDMHGVGAKTAEKLNKINIKTIGDLAKSDQAHMKTMFGKQGLKLYLKANGIDERDVDPEAAESFKSIGHSTTLPEDATDEGQIKSVLGNLSASVEKRMQRHDVTTYNVQLTIRYHNRQTITRQRALSSAVFNRNELLDVAWQLFQDHWSGDPIRLVGVTASDLIDKQHAYTQLDLFSYAQEERSHALTEAIDAMNEKYGKAILQKGRGYMDRY